MKKIVQISLIPFLLLFATFIANAQRAGNEWRVSSKLRTFANGQKYLYEYTYSSDGRIESVKYFTAAGAVSVTINEFQFDRNGKPSAYLVTWNGQRATAQVELGYNGEGKLSRMQKTQDNGDKTTFTYSYSRNTVTVTESVPESQKGGNSSMSFYNDNGDYTVTTGDAASRKITSVITLKQNAVPSPENEADKYFGGFEAPAFLGTNANGTDPQIDIEKNENGLIVSRAITKQSGVITTTYNYINIKKQPPVAGNAGTVIQTNITCDQGKKMVERVLKAQEGVKAVMVDIRTGKLLLDYSSDGTPYTEIIKLINEAGYDADQVKSREPEKNACIKQPEPAPYTPKTGINIFDARKGFAKKPIKFVPFVVTPDAAAKGFKMDSVYTWKGPDDKIKTATGAQILQQVNEMEQELSLRGRTLRQKNSFAALNYKLTDAKALLKVPAEVTKTSKVAKYNTPGTNLDFNKLPVIKTKYNKIKDISGLLSTTIGGDVGIYFGNIKSNSGEFQGMISNTGMVNNSVCKKDCPVDLTISMDAKMIGSLNISNCVLEISANPNRKPNDIETALATANFDFRKPARTKSGTQNMMVNGDQPPSFHTLYYFPVKLNDLSKLPMAAIKPVEYYAYVKFYNDKGQLLFYGSYNTAILINQVDIPIFISQNKDVNVKFEDDFFDPTGLFGMYYKSNNLRAVYKTERDENLVISEKTQVSGDVEIGARYYNFCYLLDNDKPKYETKQFIAANFSSDYTNRYKQGAPQIRIPGQRSNDMNNYKGYEINYSLSNGLETSSYNKSSAYVENKKVEQELINKSFLIGPVPCNITVKLEGNATLSRKAIMDTLSNGNVNVSTTITPHLDLRVIGSGGVDAGIAYAKVVADVTVIEVDMPITVAAKKDADIDADLKISALSGQIYFTAGICIPIPWFDDICTNFRIDIFDWKGPSATYNLVK